MWLVLTVGFFCPGCEERVGAIPAWAAEHDDLEVLYVVGDDESYNPATLEFCQRYAASNGLEPSKVVCDASFQTVLQNISDYSANSSIEVPMEMVLRASNMELLYHSTPAEEGPESAILMWLNE